MVRGFMKEKWKSAALLAPVPAVLVSCGNAEKPNVLTVAWTGILSSRPLKTYISIRPERYSYGLIKSGGVFAINLPTAEMVRKTDLCGVKSGADTDKFAVCGFKAEPCFQIDTVSIAQCPVTLECRVTDIIPLGTHDMLIAEILCCGVDPEYVRDGKLRMDKCRLFAYAHGEYFALGKRLGKFGFSVQKKANRRK